MTTTMLPALRRVAKPAATDTMSASVRTALNLNGYVMEQDGVRRVCDWLLDCASRKPVLRVVDMTTGGVEWFTKQPAARVTGSLKRLVMYAERAAALQLPHLVPKPTAEYLAANLPGTEVSGANQKLCRLIDEAISTDRLRTDQAELVSVLRQYRLQRVA